MITKEQATKRNPGSPFYVNTEFHSSLWHNKDGTCERWRRNGQTITWKSTSRVTWFQIPVKYGLYAYRRITHDNAGEFHLASECPQLRQGDQQQL